MYLSLKLLMIHLQEWWNIFKNKSAFKLQHNWVKVNYGKSPEVIDIFDSVTKTDRWSLSWSQTTHVTLLFSSYQQPLISVQNMTFMQHVSMCGFVSWINLRSPALPHLLCWWLLPTSALRGILRSGLTEALISPGPLPTNDNRES